MERFKLAVGHNHEVRPGNIVGAIANEAGIDSQYIGRINIHDEYTMIDLPADMPKEVFNDLKKVWVAGQQLKISRMGDDDSSEDRKPRYGKNDKPGKNTSDKNRSEKPRDGKSKPKKDKKKKAKKRAKDKKAKGKRKTDDSKPKKRVKKKLTLD